MPGPPSIEQLYDAHAAGLFHYFRSFVRDEADARDLLQDLFAKLAVQKLAAVDCDRAWLWRMAHNLAVDGLRRRGVRQTAEQRLAGEPATAWFQAAADPDTGLFARQAEAALEALPPEQQRVAFLKLWQGLTLEQIAEAQSIPVNTAASRYRYALEKLRSALQPLYEEIRP